MATEARGVESDHDESIDLFQEPADYYQPEKPPTFAEYQLKSGQTLSLRLIGHSPLWGHLIWNAAQVTTAFIEDHAVDLIKGKTVLELGAGAGLPSLACAIHGASKVVITDYPEADLVANLRYNLEQCDLLADKSHVAVEGYLWGNPIDPLLHYIKPDAERFDVLILADILFNHSEHDKLIKTLRDSMMQGPGAVALVFFTPYRPWLLDKDLHFFELAKENGFSVTKILEHRMDKLMFDKDPGDELLRRTVFGYEVRWAN